MIVDENKKDKRRTKSPCENCKKTDVCKYSTDMIGIAISIDHLFKDEHDNVSNVTIDCKYRDAIETNVKNALV